MRDPLIRIHPAANPYTEILYYIHTHKYHYNKRILTPVYIFWQTERVRYICPSQEEYLNEFTGPTAEWTIPVQILLQQLQTLLALCEENPSIIGGFPRQNAIHAELCWFLNCTPEHNPVAVIWDSTMFTCITMTHNGRDGVSNHQTHDCLLNRLFGLRSKKTSKLRVTGLCAGNSPGTGEFTAQMASNAKNVSIWWRHHDPW